MKIDYAILSYSILGGLVCAVFGVLLFGWNTNAVINSVAMYVAAFYFGRWWKRNVG